MGRSLSIIKCCSAFTINKAGSSFVTPGLQFRHVVRCYKEGPRKITIGSEQGITCTRSTNINNMHVNLSWLKVENRLTLSLLVVGSVDVLNAPRCLFKLLTHSSDTHAYPTSFFPIP
jgi:hypothetical protein